MKQLDRTQIYTSYMYSYPHKTAYGTIAADQPALMKQLYEARMNLYIHIPFCETKCGYCNLFSVTGKDERYFTEYLRAVREQAKQYGLLDRTLAWDSFTIGGGTPMILGEPQLAELFLLARQLGVLDADSCIETSPNQTTEEKIAILKDNRINRVSIGIQSFLDTELQELQRRHNVQSANRALSILKEASFDCLNLDLIYGIRGQTRDSVQYSLEQAIQYQPDELFIYPLYIRKGTGMHSRAQVQNEDTYQFYWRIREYLLMQGYHQVSMRRFVRVQTRSAAGCGFETTLSLGCGGRSYIGNVHCCTPYAVSREACLAHLGDYMEAKDKCQIDFGYILDEEEQQRRYVIKNLLHVDGIRAAEYRQIFGSEPMEDFPEINDLIGQQYCEVDTGADGARIRLTELGMSLSDYIGPMFISQEVMEKMKRW
ncbi:MAG: STM4012 family radical SAM protein [Lachnospiraceae bacterium]